MTRTHRSQQRFRPDQHEVRSSVHTVTWSATFLHVNPGVDFSRLGLPFWDEGGTENRVEMKLRVVFTEM